MLYYPFQPSTVCVKIFHLTTCIRTTTRLPQGSGRQQFSAVLLPKYGFLTGQKRTFDRMGNFETCRENLHDCGHHWIGAMHNVWYWKLISLGEWQSLCDGYWSVPPSSMNTQSCETFSWTRNNQVLSSWKLINKQSHSFRLLLAYLYTQGLSPKFSYPCYTAHSFRVCLSRVICIGITQVFCHSCERIIHLPFRIILSISSSTFNIL